MPIGTTNFPASLDDASSLIRAANRASSTVGTGGIDATATTIPVASASAAPQDGVCLIGEEIVLYTGKTSTTLTGCTRGYDGTTAASHAEGAPVYFDIIIADECHRGGANDESTWRGILEYFSPAVQIGLSDAITDLGRPDQIGEMFSDCKLVNPVGDFSEITWLFGFQARRAVCC